MADEINIQRFAERVERMCDFVIAKLTNEGIVPDERDKNALLKLKEEAADISTGKAKVTKDLFTGFADYMEGAP